MSHNLPQAHVCFPKWSTQDSHQQTSRLKKQQLSKGNKHRMTSFVTRCSLKECSPLMLTLSSLSENMQRPSPPTHQIAPPPHSTTGQPLQDPQISPNRYGNLCCIDLRQDLCFSHTCCPAMLLVRNSDMSPSVQVSNTQFT